MQKQEVRVVPLALRWGQRLWRQLRRGRGPLPHYRQQRTGAEAPLRRFPVFVRGVPPSDESLR